MPLDLRFSEREIGTYILLVSSAYGTIRVYAMECLSYLWVPGVICEILVLRNLEHPRVIEVMASRGHSGIRFKSLATLH